MSKNNHSLLDALVDGDPCPVCRRGKTFCICVSHQPVKPMSDEAPVLQRPQRPYSDAYTDILVNQAVQFYYDRDAEGLAKWLRKALR